MMGPKCWKTLALALGAGWSSACTAGGALAPDDGPLGRAGSGNSASSDASGAPPPDGAFDGCVEETGQGGLGTGEPAWRCTCGSKTYSPVSSTVAPNEVYAVTRTRLPLARLVVCGPAEAQCVSPELCDAGCFDADAGFLEVVRMLFPGPLGEALTA